MGLKPGDFEEFFKAVNGNHKPFRWQKNLLDAILSSGRWPDRIAAPTGSGKTSAIDVHVFATALSSQDGWPRLPRRLAMVVDRRVLVDDQYARARSLADRLRTALVADDDSVVGEVARQLVSLDKLDKRADSQAPVPYPLLTAKLRGGSVPSRSWRDYPAACAVLSATPDMWGSRLLFRGYGTSDRAASREAGLLAIDSVVLVDEAHLSRQLLVTAERVSELAAVAEQPLVTVPMLQVVAVSATPGKGEKERMSVAVDGTDLAEDTELRRRLQTPKPVRLAEVQDWPQARQLAKIAAAAAQAVVEMRTELTALADSASAGSTSAKVSATIGCYVNTVPMALAVAGLLRDQGLRVVTVCGQVRPGDLDRLKVEYPGLLSVTGSDEVDVLVTTQSLEVGADLDLAGIVTELASGSALAQRAGRVNRLGKRSYTTRTDSAGATGQRRVAAVTVLVPQGDLPTNKDIRSGPYSAAELNASLTWIRELESRDLGIAPWAVQHSSVPEASARRTLNQRPELGDVWHWARTSDTFAVEPELDLWLSDSLEAETSIGLAVRDALPVDPTQAEAFIQDLPPGRREVFPVPYGTALAVLSDLLPSGKAGQNGRSGGRERPQLGQAGEPDRTPVPVRVRGEDTSQLRRRDNGDVDVRPGDVVVIDSSAKIATPVKGMFSPPVVVRPANAEAGTADALGPEQRVVAEDILHYLPELDTRSPGHDKGDRRIDELLRGRLLLRVEWSEDLTEIAGFPRDLARRIVTEFADADGEPEADRRRVLAALLKGIPDDEIPEQLHGLVAAVTRLLAGRVKDSEVLLQPQEAPVRVLVLDNRRATAEEDRQVFARREHDVYLNNHQVAVGERAAWLAENLLPVEKPEIREALRLAALHHDDGKADHRFQLYRLGASGNGEPLAKSRRETIRETRRDWSVAGLPASWRHEQRSVVDAWEHVQVADTDPDLCLRLIGTSHGFGRSGFPHASSEMAGKDDPAPWVERAADLFDLGGWDELIEGTHLRYGVWGCAWLEAVLRAADCQVSGEGN